MARQVARAEIAAQTTPGYVRMQPGPRPVRRQSIPRSRDLPRSIVRLSVLAALMLAAAPHARGAASEPASWGGDVRFLVAAVDSIHPEPYKYFKRAAWDSAAADLERRLPGMRADQAIAAISQMLGMLHDGHSRLSQVQLPSHGRPALVNLPYPGFDTTYPLEFEVFADGLWIVSATTAHAELSGAHVTAIGGKPVANAVAALAPFIPADNSMWVLRTLPAYLRCPGYVAAAGLTPGPTAPLKLTLATTKGGRREVTIAAEKPDSSATWVAADRDVRASLPLGRSLAYPFAFADVDDNTVFARIHAIVSEPGRESLASFVARLFAHVDSLGSPRLILDLRGNGGGDNYLNQPLVHAILRRPAFDRPGRLFVIVDRGTFSAAVSLSSELERETPALFVGEPTGAAPNSPGDPARRRLPASALGVRISTVMWNGSDPRDPRTFIAPDLPAMPTFADWLAHKDPVLDAIRAYRPAKDAPDPPPNQHWGAPAKLKAVAPKIAW